MKTQINKTLKYLSIAVSMIISGFVSVNADTVEKFSSDNDAQLIYQSQSANHSIYGYPSSLSGEVSLKPELIYVNQAYGPAIHSYAHSGSETAVPWNVEYVDTAYGQAIYSYERHQTKGVVEVLPIMSN
ncbi:MAG: hypothetical protein ACXWTS_09670 [Methylococcaceae bacterium]